MALAVRCRVEGGEKESDMGALQVKGMMDPNDVTMLLIVFITSCQVSEK